MACDGSKITLPNNEAIKKVFGSKAIGNHTGNPLGQYSQATYHACYDVLNHVAVKSILGHGSSYEVDQAEEIIPLVKPDDLLIYLLIYDRGYASYRFMATLLAHEKHFIIRCPKSFFKEVPRLFDDDAPSSRIVPINVPNRQKKHIKEARLPETIRIRLVSIPLSSGEREVLARIFHEGRGKSLESLLKYIDLNTKTTEDLP